MGRRAQPVSRLSLAVSLGALGFLGTEFAVTATHAPTLWYHPLARQFMFGRFMPSPAMDFYGRILSSTIGGLIFFAVGAAVFGHNMPDQAVRRWEQRMAVWVSLMVIAAAALHVATLYNRVPVPLETPP